MKPISSRRARAIVVALAAGSLALTACSKNEGGDSGADSKKDQKEASVQSKAVTYADAAGSTGPAEEVPGAKPGGTINVYQEAGLSHLDPGQIYVSDSRPGRQPALPSPDPVQGGRQGRRLGRR